MHANNIRCETLFDSHFKLSMYGQWKEKSLKIHGKGVHDQGGEEVFV